MGLWSRFRSRRWWDTSPPLYLCFLVECGLRVVFLQIFCLVLVFGCIFVSNIAFGFFRHKAYSAPLPHASFPAPPVQHFPQQQRHMDFGGGQQFFTPYQQRVGEPGMVFGIDQSGRVSPSKRVGYR